MSRAIRDIIFLAMLNGIRQLLVFMAMFGLATGNAFAANAPPRWTATSCEHEHRSTGHQDQRPQDPRWACCCGLGIIAPALLTASATIGWRPAGLSRVAYWPDVERLISRSIPPDPAPPRTRV